MPPVICQGRSRPANWWPIAINRLGIPTGRCRNDQIRQSCLTATKAPLVSVTSTQITAMVPYEIAGKATTVLAISIAGQSAAPITLSAALTAPGIFITGNGPTNGRNHQAAVLNQDGTANSQSNPAVARLRGVDLWNRRGRVFPRRDGWDGDRCLKSAVDGCFGFRRHRRADLAGRRRRSGSRPDHRSVSGEPDSSTGGEYRQGEGGAHDGRRGLPIGRQHVGEVAAHETAGRCRKVSPQNRL